MAQRWVFATKQVPECHICSNHMFEICHPHLTTLGQVTRSRSTANILIGSSTLHNVWKYGQFRNKVTDFYHDIIIGGKIHDSHFSFLENTKGWKDAANIVIACGNNNADFQYNDSDEDIITQLESLVHSIERQNRRHNIVIASLLYAPKFCDNSLPKHRNMLNKVRKVNRWIYKFNRNQTGLQLDISKYGVIGDPSEGSYINHEYKDWREPNVDKKLHLVDSVKEKIAAELIELYKKLDDS